MKDNNQHSSGHGIACGESFAVLLGDFFDGTLSEQKANEVQQHMDSCENCRRMAQVVLRSNALTQKARNDKAEYIHGISGDRTLLQIEKIKQSIRMEYKGKHPLESIDQGTRKTKTFFARFPKRMSFIYTAAGFTVLIFVLALFIGGNNILKNLTKSTDFLANTPDYYGSCSEDSRDGMTNEAATSSTALGSTDDAEQYSQSDKGLYSGGSAPSQAMAEIISSIVIADDYSNELVETMKGSVAYIGIENNEESFLAIAAYPDSTIQKKVDALFEIGDELRLMHLIIEIEIISGENSQKLVEYTSRENVTFLQEVAEDNSAEFLVITINR